ncbi:MAG: SDR family oxidoreductase [bacterium]|jgi:pteridine reductase|nr:SDR family oxidoreductase [Phycisphaeraceae bacterium]
MKGDRPIAIITGAAKRVGRAIAVALAKQGCDIIATYNTSSAAAEVTAEQVQIDAPRATIILKQLDLEDLNSVDLLAAQLSEQLPRLDVLIHNASLYEPTPTQRLTPEACQRFYRVNALAPLMLSRTLAGKLASSKLPGGGAIVTMCDIHAMGALGQPRRDHLAYSMSKAALLEMTLVLARELAPRVRVNAVAPGVVAFPEAGRESDADAQARYLSRVPLARAGTPADAAEAVAWLALRAHYCTGQVINVDGGRSIT